MAPQKFGFSHKGPTDIVSVKTIEQRHSSRIHYSQRQEVGDYFVSLRFDPTYINLTELFKRSGRCASFKHTTVLYIILVKFTDPLGIINVRASDGRMLN